MPTEILKKQPDFADVSALTMNSLEIAKLTRKEHRNVLADIRRMLDGLHGKGGSTKFSAVYKDQQLIDRPCFHLPKRETLILVSGYSVSLRAKIIDRWQELEAQAAANVPDLLNMPMAELIQFAIDAEERRLAAKRTLEDQKRKVAVLDRIAAAEGSFSLRKTALIVQQGPNVFYEALRKHGWLYKPSSKSTHMPCQDKIQDGLLSIEEQRGKVDQVKVTAKGLTQIAILFQRIKRGEVA